jgi:hypothetical protein
MRKAVLALLVVGLVANVTFADDAATAEKKTEKTKVESGLKVGDYVSPFHVTDVTGSEAGDSLCYTCKYGGRPVVGIFVREINEDVAKLIQGIDESVGKNSGKQMRSYVVLMTDDPDAEEAKLKKIAAKYKIKNVPLTTFDGVKGPPSYKISKKAEVTVLMWKGQEVKANHAFAKAKDVDKKSAKAVVADTSKILKSDS